MPRVVAIAVALFLMLGTAHAAKPNIVVILTDDQPVGTEIRMPNLQALVAGKGVTFERSYVNYPLCAPSRASFLLGQTATNTGILGNSHKSFGGYKRYKKKESNSLNVWLKDAGYRTIWIGKFINGYQHLVPHRPPGWDYWFAETNVAPYDFSVLDNDGEEIRYGSAPEDYEVDVVAAEAVRQIAETAGDTAPLFMVVSPFSPHYPHVPPDRYKATYGDLALPMPPNFNEPDIADKPGWRQPPPMDPAAIATLTADYRSRAGQLRAVDDLVGDIVKALSEAGRLEDTYIVFTSDNGYAEGQHRTPKEKSVGYEEVARVPLFIRGPGIPAGEVRDQIVNNLDLTATIVDWAGAVASRPLDGRSLVPVLADADAPWRTMMLVQGATTPGANPNLGREINRFWGGISDRWRVFMNRPEDGSEALELYDMAIDPWQLENVADDPDYAGVLAALKPIVADRLAKCREAGCWYDAPEPPGPEAKPE